MADSSKNSPAVDLSRHGVPGLPRYSGWVLDEWLAPLQGARGRKVLREMQDDEPIIGALLFSLEMLLRQTHWSIEPGDESATGIENGLFILECWEDMRQPWDATLGEILTFLPYGWSLFEEIYKYRKAGQSKFTDGRIGWDSWSMRSQETLLSWDFDPITGEAVAMIQLGPPDWLRHEIPLSKSLLFRTTTKRGNPEGRSILRNAYRPWFFKKHIETIEGIGIERDLAGLPVLYIPSDTIMGLAENSVLAYAEYQKVISNVKRDDNEGIILPSDRDEQGHRTHELTLLSASGNRQFDTNSIITRKAQEILMTTMTDFITLGHERVGSNALAQEKGRLFVAALEAWQQSIIGPINTRAIPRLLALNGMDISHAPVLTAGDVDRPDLDMLSNFVLRLAQAGFQMDLEAKGELLKRLMEVANLGEPNPSPTVFPVQVNVRNPEGGPDANPTALPTKPAAPQKAA